MFFLDLPCSCACGMKVVPKMPPLDRIWHYPCKDNPFVQDIQNPRLAMDAHRQIDLFDPLWGSSRASHSNNDGISRDFSNFSHTRHQLMLLHRGNRQWLPPAEFPPWPQAPQAPVRSNASGGKSIPPIADVILYLMWCNVINQIIIMNSYNKHLGMVWIPFMVTLGMVHEVYALGFTRFTTCNWRTWVYQWEVPSARGIYHFFLLGTSVSNQESVLIRCWTYVVSGQEPDYKPVISGMSLVLSLSMYIWV